MHHLRTVVLEGAAVLVAPAVTPAVAPAVVPAVAGAGGGTIRRSVSLVMETGGTCVPAVAVLDPCPLLMQLSVHPSFCRFTLLFLF